MPHTYYDRLSALDASFLRFEESNSHWHEAAVMVLDAKPLRTEDGGLDFEKVLHHYEWCFEQVPRYRQRLVHIPLFDHPVWADDASFNIRYHIRQVALPQPADERMLKRVCGYLLELPLDIDKPPWEVWVVDGLQGDRFALVTKIHHCMADGISGMSILQTLLRPQPFEREGNPPPWTAREAPSPSALVASELSRRLRAPIELLAPVRRPSEALHAARDVVEGLIEASRVGWREAAKTPLNPERIGPHRRFDWTEVSLGEIKQVKGKLGGTVNDVVLTTAAGALGDFLRRRGLDTTHIDFRALIPVNVRKKRETDLGNRVAMVMVELPVGEQDPVSRLYRVVETTQKLKHSKQALGVSWLEHVADRVGGRFFVELSRSATRHRPFNVAITNVPGPPTPLYFLGAQMHAIYPMMPLFPNQALSLAVLSYDGKVFWGFNSDWDALPDVHDLVAGIVRQFRDLYRTIESEGTTMASASL
ncbi:MAG: wax ester/triacylglycerol synthase family O-acyltransferase [Myxococcales bacterium]|jgi:WS/DGAT/MGAT family acyltransferase